MNDLSKVNSDRRLTIGLITSQVHTLVFEDQWQGVFEAAQKMDINLIIYPGCALDSPYYFEKQGNLLYETALQPEFFDGLIIWTGALDWYVSDEALALFVQRFSGIPLVSMETALAGMPTIGIGNYQGMWDLVQHMLVVHDYKRIAFVTGPAGHRGVAKRYQAYCECLAAYDIPFDPELVVVGDFSSQSGKTAVSTLIDERQKEFDAVIAANDKMAVGVLSELQAREFVVPTQKAVAGFDDDQTTSPPLTTTYPPFIEMGHIALETCVAMIEGRQVPELIEMPAELVIRRSCGCLPLGLEEALIFPNATLSEPDSIWQKMITAVVETIPNCPPLDMLEVLAQAFEQSVLACKYDLFLTKLDKILLLDVTNNRDLKRWHEVISCFRIGSKGVWTNAQHENLAEDLYHQARLLIVDTQHWTYEYQIVVAKETVQQLHEIGNSLITAFSLEEVMNLVVEKFPEIGVQQCAIALYTTKDPVPLQSELLVVYDENGRFVLPPNQMWEFTENALPSMFLNQDKNQTFIVAPLYFREEALGVVVLGVEPKDGLIYETLRMQLSSALKHGLMVKDIQNAQNKLEQRVLDRTSALTQEVDLHKKTADALQKSEETTRALLEAIPDAIFLVDQEARFLNFIPSEGWKTAVSFDDYLGLNLMDVFPPELAQKFAVTLSEAAHSENVLLQEYMIEIGQEERHYEARLLGIGEGNVLGIIRDITERKQNETEREQLIIELESKNAELERFTYTVSHDLKSPLVTIQGFIGFLESDIAHQKWENISNDVSHIRKAAEKMQVLLQDLLNLSRSGRTINPEPVPFEEIVHDALLNLVIQYQERGVKLIVPVHMPIVLVDRLRMIEVLQNLLENAVKFMGDQPEPIVEVGTIQKDDKNIFFVKDNGIGLDTKYHEKVFNLFERMHLEVEGSGVGLALVKRIIEMHNGQIWVESFGNGMGSTFFFTLPLAHLSASGQNVQINTN